jgi:hypothetical protein
MRRALRVLRPIGMPLLLGSVLAFWPVAIVLWLVTLPVLGMKARRQGRR